MKLIPAYLLILALVILSACAQPAEVPPPSAPPPATITQEEAEAPPSSTPPPTITQEDMDAARQVIFEYYEAFNNYDLEGALACLEESYAQERAEGLESDMKRAQSFNVTVTPEEEVEPTVTPEGKVLIQIKLKTPLGTEHVTYHVVKVNGDWKICLSER